MLPMATGRVLRQWACGAPFMLRGILSIIGAGSLPGPVKACPCAPGLPVPAPPVARAGHASTAIEEAGYRS
jgi:hypothetical protein